MTRILIGVIGPGELATEPEISTAYALGAAIAKQQWILVTGGRAAGVMEAASQGAQAANGLVIGILPGEDMSQMSSSVHIPILTGMGQGRNVINVLSSRVVIACGCGPGTLSEMALALKLGRPLILLRVPPEWADLMPVVARSPTAVVSTVAEAIAQTHHWLAISSSAHTAALDD